MNRSLRLMAIVVVLTSITVWGVGGPAAMAQAPTGVIELNFETASGEAPADGLAVLHLDTGIEYRSDRVSQGDSIEVTAAIGNVNRLQIRRTDLQPGAVSCEGALAAEAVAGSDGATLAITPADDRVVCTVTLLDELPVTGVSTTLFAVSILLLQAGAIMVGASRSLRD